MDNNIITINVLHVLLLRVRYKVQSYV